MINQSIEKRKGAGAFMRAWPGAIVESYLPSLQGREARRQARGPGGRLARAVTSVTISIDRIKREAYILELSHL